MPTIAIRIEKQVKTHWCWLATAISIAKYYDPNYRKSQQDTIIWLLNTKRVDRLLKKFQRESSVNFPAKVEDLLDELDMIANTEDVPLSFDDLQAVQSYGDDLFDRIKTEIDNQRPIPIAVKLKGSDAEGHYLMIVGYSGNDIIWLDPSKGGVSTKLTSKDDLMINIGNLAYLRGLVYTKAPG